MVGRRLGGLIVLAVFARQFKPLCTPNAGCCAGLASLLLLAGAGIGMAWPHLSVRAMESVDDPAESGVAAAAINTVQLISAAFGAGLAGVVVNTSTGGEVAEARWLYTVFTVLAATGIVASFRATHRDRNSAR